MIKKAFQIYHNKEQNVLKYVSRKIVFGVRQRRTTWDLQRKESLYHKGKQIKNNIFCLKKESKNKILKKKK